MTDDYDQASGSSLAGDAVDSLRQRRLRAALDRVAQTAEPLTAEQLAELIPDDGDIGSDLRAALQDAPSDLVDDLATKPKHPSASAAGPVSRHGGGKDTEPA